MVTVVTMVTAIKTETISNSGNGRGNVLGRFLVRQPANKQYIHIKMRFNLFANAG